MQEFKKPLRELEEIYTRSEMAIMSWASQEQAYNMEEMSKTNRDKQPSEMPRVPVKQGDNEEMDFRKKTGNEVWQIMKNQGINFPMIRKDI
jgi:hypothetical protein